jgi:hypothetical protein
LIGLSTLLLAASGCPSLPRFLTCPRLSRFACPRTMGVRGNSGVRGRLHLPSRPQCPFQVRQGEQVQVKSRLDDKKTGPIWQPVFCRGTSIAPLQGTCAQRHWHSFLRNEWLLLNSPVVLLQQCSIPPPLFVPPPVPQERILPVPKLYMGSPAGECQPAQPGGRFLTTSTEHPE